MAEGGVSASGDAVEGRGSYKNETEADLAIRYVISQHSLTCFGMAAAMKAGLLHVSAQSPERRFTRALQEFRSCSL